jgi:hypothetical protein
MGWMASHAAKATKLAAKLASGEASTADRVDAAKLIGSYSRQIARVFREREIASRPDLLATAAVFGVRAGEPAPSAPGAHSEASSAEAAPTTAVAPPTAASEPAPAPKKRGRPKGSKNRPQNSGTPARKRRP